MAGLVLIAAPIALLTRPLATGTALPSRDVTAVGRARDALATMPAALAEVPDAMATVAHGSVADARRRLDATPALAPLARQVSHPGALTRSLDTALADAVSPSHRGPMPAAWIIVIAAVLPGVGALAARRGSLAVGLLGGFVVLAFFVPWAGASLSARSRSTADAGTSMSTELATLQTAYGDVVPAVQAAATVRLSAAGAVAAIDADPRAADLARLLGNLRPIIGGVVLAEQAATEHSAATRSGPARRLPEAILIPGCVLIVACAVGRFGPRLAVES